MGVDYESVLGRCRMFIPTIGSDVRPCLTASTLIMDLASWTQSIAAGPDSGYAAGNMHIIRRVVCRMPAVFHSLWTQLPQCRRTVH